MPLSELVYRLAEGKFDSSQEKIPTCSTDMSIGPENDFVELVWENGQIQSSKGRKNQISNGVPSQNSKFRDKDIGNGSNSKMGRFGAMDSVLGEVPMTLPSVGLGLNQDDEVVPWLNYPIDDSLQHDYCSEFLTELSGVTVNENSQNHYVLLDRRSSGNHSIRDSHTVSAQDVSVLDQAHMQMVSSTEDANGAGPRTSVSQLYPSSSQQCQSLFPHFRSKASVNNGENVNNLSRHAASGDSIRGPAPGGGFPSTKAQKQIPVSSSTNPNLMNFSHFSRLVSLVKADVHNIGVRAGSGISSMERMGGKDKGSIASSSNPVAPMFVETIGGFQKDLGSPSQHVMVSSKVDAKPLNRKPNEELLSSKQPEALDQENDSRNDRSRCQIAEIATRGLADAEKNAEPVVAASSVCSGNSVERISDEPTQDLKRKHREIEDSEGPSEDVEEESVGGKKAASARGNSAKRSRAAEVHNLSERRRRDRINEKMRALQELIPNCNKVDKASMLDEAIEYLKTLQLQVQIMSMGAGLYMPSMMLHPGMAHMHAPHMAQFSTMGIGMGMGMGMGFGMGMPDMIGGSSACSMIQMPPMHGAHFPNQTMSGQSALHGMGGSNLPIFGFSGQAHPMPYHCPPLMPMSGGPLLKTTMGMNAGGVTGPMDNPDSAPAFCSKDSIQNINSQTMQNCVTKSPVNQTYNQCQATNEQPALVQNNGQATEVTENGALKSANGNDNVPGGAAAGCD